MGGRGSGTPGPVGGVGVGGWGSGGGAGGLGPGRFAVMVGDMRMCFPFSGYSKFRFEGNVVAGKRGLRKHAPTRGASVVRQLLSRRPGVLPLPRQVA